MSGDDGSGSDGGGGAGNREVAWRVFAAEYDDATFGYSEGEQERAPNYVVTPTGGRVNRVFVVGVLTAVESVSDDVVRARIVDPTGAFVVYAGQYQPDPLAFLERADPPAFVAVTGKARTFQPDGSDVVYTSIRPESINRVDAEARDRWVVATAERTLHRVSRFADAIDRPERGDDLEAVLATAGVDAGLAAGIPRALEQYGTTSAYLAAVGDLALDAVRVVAGEIEEADPLALAPDEGGAATVDFDVSLGEADEPASVADAEVAVESAGGSADSTAEDDSADETTAVDDAHVTEDSTDDEPSAPAVGAAADPSTADQETTDDGTTLDESSDDETADEAAGDTGATEASASDASAADADGMYELDEEEREQIEAEYGTEFDSGSDIPDAGEADIETPEPEETTEPDGTPEPDEAAEQADDEEPETAADGTPEAGETPADAGTVDDDEPTDDEPAGTVEKDEPAETADEDEPAGTADEDEPAGADDGAAGGVPDDLVEVVVARMEELADGDGADRGELVAAVTAEWDVEDDEVEAAIQDALMGGRCYEPADGVIQPI